MLPRALGHVRTLIKDKLKTKKVKGVNTGQKENVMDVLDKCVCQGMILGNPGWLSQYLEPLKII
jgi:hypothetical protein